MAMLSKLTTVNENRGLSKGLLRGVQWTAIAGSIVLLAACASTETSPTSTTSAAHHDQRLPYRQHQLF